MSSLASGLTALLAVSTAIPAASQVVASTSGPAESADEAIIVEGQRIDVPAFLRGAINNVGVTQLARFEDRVCPGVVGVGGAQALKLLQMIRDNVVALGGTLANPGCTANATVIFAEQPIEFVKHLAKKKPAYFTMSPRALEQFTAHARPVVSWHVTEIRDRDGKEVGSAGELAMAKRSCSVCRPHRWSQRMPKSSAGPGRRASQLTSGRT